MAAVNRQITLASRPLGLPKISDFQLGYAALPSPAAGEALVRTLYLSLDPYMRWMQGKLRYREDVAQGIEAAPQAFIGMLQGNNQGKQLVQLSVL